jgi:hypothetical protein
VTAILQLERSSPRNVMEDEASVVANHRHRLARLGSENSSAAHVPSTQNPLKSAKAVDFKGNAV